MGINILTSIGGIMKDAVIFYFSGTGNTWWISNRIAEALEAKEISASTVSIEKISADEANDCERIIRKKDLMSGGQSIFSCPTTYV